MKCAAFSQALASRMPPARNGWLGEKPARRAGEPREARDDIGGIGRLELEAAPDIGDGRDDLAYIVDATRRGGHDIEHRLVAAGGRVGGRGRRSRPSPPRRAHCRAGTTETAWPRRKPRLRC